MGPVLRFSSAVALAFALVSASTAAFAQDDPATVQARQRWREGVSAFDRGDYELARAAFAQVYALKPTPPVLRNLGEAEVAAGDYVSGAAHLSQFLREAEDLAPEERAKVERSLAKAESQVGRIELTTDVEGAEIFVDNQRVGITPVNHVLHVKAGWREVRLSKGGRDVQRLIETTPGHVFPLRLFFSSEKKDGETTAPPLSASAGLHSSELDGAARWRVPVLISGGVLTLAGVGLGTYFVIRAGNLEDDANDLRRTIGAGSPGACLTGDAACQDLERKVADGRDAEKFAVAGFVAGGVFAAGTALAWWLWPRAKRPEVARSLELSPLSVAPLRSDASPHAASVTPWGGALSGTF